MPSLYKIRNATELEWIFLYLCNVSKDLSGVSRPTVENYIPYLESANLIYIADAAIRNAVLMDDSLLSDPVEMGKIVETAVYKHVAAFYYQ